MAYIVNIEVGSGINKTRMQSIPLSNRIKVGMYIKRNPAIKSNTNVKVTNTFTKRSVIAKPSYFTNTFGKFQKGL